MTGGQAMTGRLWGALISITDAIRIGCQSVAQDGEASNQDDTRGSLSFSSSRWQELCRYTCHTSGSSHLKGLLHSWTGWVDVQHIQIYPSCQPTHPRHWHGVCRIHIGCQDTGTNADVESACNVEICRMAVGCQLTDPIPDMEQMIVHSFANLQLQIGRWSRDESFQVIS